jgi:anti-sigma regulatory factor (Ser/Thr protein kinase)/Fe-S-cluster formation regulator IscX/YfhJ
MLYRGTDDYVAQLSGFIDDGLRSGQSVLIAVPGQKAELLQDHVPDLDRVVFVDMTQLGRNPSRIIPAISEFLDEERRPCRFIEEPRWPGRSPAETAEATRHEALINLALAGYPLEILCLYDVANLSDEVVADAWRTHPEVIVDRVPCASDHYALFDAVWSDDRWPLSPPPPNLRLDVSFDELSALRSQVDQEAAAVAMDPERAQDLVLAVNEVASNSIVHGGGSGTLQVWRHGSRALVCEVRDAGVITDPLVGRRGPGPHLEAKGLWLVNQLCDLVEIRSGPGGTCVRLRVDG